MKILSKTKFKKNGKTIKKYKLFGISVLRKEILPDKKKYKFLGIKVCRKSVTSKFVRTIIKKQHNGKNKGVIYTCITGGYDNLIQHNYQDLNWDYICFTDNEDLLKQRVVGHWTIEPLRFSLLDNVRNARWHKTHPHKLLSKYEYSIWIDGNINITGSLLFDKAKKCINENRILSVHQHPLRNCVYDEAIACMALKKDKKEIINTEIAVLKQLGFPENMGLNETNIMFRFHNHKKCIAIMEDWFEFIEKYSRRDQLSFNYVVWKNKYEMVNFLGPCDVRHNPMNFLIVKSDNHNGSYVSNPKKSNLTITIIVPIYNALDDVKILFNSLENSNLSEKVKIILINDCSNEETQKFLHDFVQKKERYTLLENEENLGFVKTCNKGMRIADTDLIILLNSVTMIPQRFETRVLDCFESDNTIAIASPLASSSGLWDLPYKQGMNFHQMDKRVESVSKCWYPDILLPEGFCFCVRKKVLDDIGLLDEIYGRGYCEETDLALRALNAGYRTVLIDNLYIYHKRHASFGSDERNKQLEKNRSILWGRYRNLYDKKMETVQMKKIKHYIKQSIYK